MQSIHMQSIHAEHTCRAYTCRAYTCREGSREAPVCAYVHSQPASTGPKSSHVPSTVRVGGGEEGGEGREGGAGASGGGGDGGGGEGGGEGGGSSTPHVVPNAVPHTQTPAKHSSVPSQGSDGHACGLQSRAISEGQVMLPEMPVEPAGDTVAPALVLLWGRVRGHTHTHTHMRT